MVSLWEVHSARRLQSKPRINQRDLLSRYSWHLLHPSFLDPCEHLLFASRQLSQACTKSANFDTIIQFTKQITFGGSALTSHSLSSGFRVDTRGRLGTVGTVERSCGFYQRWTLANDQMNETLLQRHWRLVFYPPAWTSVDRVTRKPLKFSKDTKGLLESETVLAQRCKYFQMLLNSNWYNSSRSSQGPDRFFFQVPSPPNPVSRLQTFFPKVGKRFRHLGLSTIIETGTRPLGQCHYLKM
jgi:hypothetical protein